MNQYAHIYIQTSIHPYIHVTILDTDKKYKDRISEKGDAKVMVGQSYVGLGNIKEILRDISDPRSS